jgi:hypothetical protein
LDGGAESAKLAPPPGCEARRRSPVGKRRRRSRQVNAEEKFVMAKGQVRSNKEARKPKKDKKAAKSGAAPAAAAKGAKK